MSNPAITSPKSLNEIFEHTACSRCGGDKAAFSSLRHINGGRCLLCDSTAFALTRRGAAAVRFYENLRAIDEADLQPGMLVRRIRAADGSEVTSDKIRIERIERTADRVTFINDTRSERTTHFRGSVYRIIPTREQLDAMIAEALAYQATLNSKGEVA